VPAAEVAARGRAGPAGGFRDPVDRVLAARRGSNAAPLRGAGMAGAVVLHLALLVAALVAPRLGHEDRQPLEFVPVALVPAQALGTGRPAPQPPAPEPEVTPPAPVAEPEPERPSPPAPAEPEERPPPRPETKPARDEPPREPARQPAGAPEQPSGPAEGAPGDRPGSPQGSPAGSAGLGATIAGVGDPSFTYGYYLDRMLALIERNWTRPPTGDALPEVALTFRILRDGTVTELAVDQGSGLTAFDLAGQRAVRNASPLPPLPSGYRKDSLSIRLIIR
jgi:TonB family protein